MSRIIITGTSKAAANETIFRLGVPDDLGNKIMTQRATQVGYAGSSLVASREDHRHPVYLLSTVGTVSFSTSTAGISEGFSRGDHVHYASPSGMPFGTYASNVSISTSTGGIANLVSRADHVHYDSSLLFIEDGNTSEVLVKIGSGNFDTDWTRNLLLSSLGSYEPPADLPVACGSNYTLVLSNEVWDDLRINAGAFDRPGVSDPTPVIIYPAAGVLGVSLYEFAKNNWVSFTVQLPHRYKQGTDIQVHVHWTPGANGVAENGNTVGWKVDYSWANIDGTFGAMATADLSDTCAGGDYAHLMTPSVTIDGHTAAKNISSMLVCNLRRSDTGADDTWVGAISGALPLILEVDFHFQIDTMGSRQAGAK